MQAILGIIFHTIGGISSGSFYVPYKKVKGWAWESYWIVGGLFSWLLLPLLAAFFTIPNFVEVISRNSDLVKSVTFTMGMLWGIGGLTYGLGVRYLGMSLGNSIVLSFCSAFGALVPAIYYDFNPIDGKTSFTSMLNSAGGQVVLIGILICLIGIAILGKAGWMKDKEFSESGKKVGDKDFSLFKGLLIAVISGILSAFFNFGIEAGRPMADNAVKLGANPLFQNNITYVVLLLGGLTTNFIWCVFLNIINKSYRDYVNIQTPLYSNILFCGFAGTLWFLQFFFYGMGESKMGNGASSWILHMATIILTANIWGLSLKEWQAVSSRTFKTFVMGVVLIFISILTVGIGNSL
jgi:L-rhamnose-H+ transport protein